MSQSFKILYYYYYLMFPQVKTLKEKIEHEKGKDSFPVTGQKLIYAGMSNNKALNHFTPFSYPTFPHVNHRNLKTALYTE